MPNVYPSLAIYRPVINTGSNFVERIETYRDSLNSAHSTEAFSGINFDNTPRLLIVRPKELLDYYDFIGLGLDPEGITAEELKGYIEESLEYSADDELELEVSGMHTTQGLKYHNNTGQYLTEALFLQLESKELKEEKTGIRGAIRRFDLPSGQGFEWFSGVANHAVQVAKHTYKKPELQRLEIVKKSILEGELLPRVLELGGVCIDIIPVQKSTTKSLS